jgi:hypothetical protein
LSRLIVVINGNQLQDGFAIASENI